MSTVPPSHASASPVFPTGLLTAAERGRLDRHLTRLARFATLLATFRVAPLPDTSDLRQDCVADLALTDTQVALAFELFATTDLSDFEIYHLVSADSSLVSS